ncbi:MAG: monovalent cation/H(+) antiporter subunit G [Trebonia sp.]
MIREVVTDVLLALATLTVVLSSAGVAVMPNAAARLHYVTPAAVVAPLLVTLAIFVKEGLDSNTGMTVIALIFMVAVSPYLSHATIRAIRARAEGDVGDPMPRLVPAKPDTGDQG